jgi:hypothetical protein
MWAWMLNDQFGIINDMLMMAGIIDERIAWTARADTAMYAVLVVDIWKTTPFMALLMLAGLQMISRDMYEAAKLDGIQRPMPADVAAEVENQTIAFAGISTKATPANLRVQAGAHRGPQDRNAVDARGVIASGQHVHPD